VREKADAKHHRSYHINRKCERRGRVHTTDSSLPSDMHFDFKRLQYPVHLSFAMTINKAQGQSLSVAGVNLESSCFSHGQLYVACTRVLSLYLESRATPGISASISWISVSTMLNKSMIALQGIEKMCISFTPSVVLNNNITLVFSFKPMSFM
jgi:hypothetical protein